MYIKVSFFLLSKKNTSRDSQDVLAVVTGVAGLRRRGAELLRFGDQGGVFSRETEFGAALLARTERGSRIPRQQLRGQRGDAHADADADLQKSQSATGQLRKNNIYT